MVLLQAVPVRLGVKRFRRFGVLEDVIQTNRLSFYSLS